MEQMYMIEIFIDKVTVYAEEHDSSASKHLIVKVKFGPKTQFIIKEGQLAKSGDDSKDDNMECDDNGKLKWSRTIRVGKSYLFPSYPDTIMMILNKFPLELEVWNDDDQEVEIFVGIGTMQWDTEFYHMLRETADPLNRVLPLTIKQKAALFAECCCRKCGEIDFILRLSAMGEAIVTEFQQLQNDPERFVFRTDKAPSMFECKRIEGDDPNFVMVGSLYETTTLENPELTESAKQQIEVCTDLQTCAAGGAVEGPECRHEKKPQKKYPIDKIRMGDIVGPCGNPNCALAHKVKNYIRNLGPYKKATEGLTDKKPADPTKKICGSCVCKDERWHREECTEKVPEDKNICKGCGGAAKTGDTCADRSKKVNGPSSGGSKTQVTYVFTLPEVPGYTYGITNSAHRSVNDIHSSDSTADYSSLGKSSRTLENIISQGGCACSNHKTTLSNSEGYVIDNFDEEMTANKESNRTLGSNPLVYNATTVSTLQHKYDVYNCTDVQAERSCKCNPPKPHPPCHTTDCDCLTEIDNIASRKRHKPFCPSYVHKQTCPVNMQNEEAGEKKEDDEDDAEPLPYGLPPVQLGPCPVMGRPCSVPDGFARMYKTAALPAQPPSYSDAGKVCCSKEYEKIKKAIKDYMKYEKEHDFRCINKFNIDTERRCCDKEQKLFSMMGKECCGSHKLSIQEKFKEPK